MEVCAHPKKSTQNDNAVKTDQRRTPSLKFNLVNEENIWVNKNISTGSKDYSGHVCVTMQTSICKKKVSDKTVMNFQVLPSEHFAKSRIVFVPKIM